MQKPNEDLDFIKQFLPFIYTRKDGAKIQISITRILDYLECLEEEIIFLKGITNANKSK